MREKEREEREEEEEEEKGGEQWGERKRLRDNFDLKKEC